MLSFSRFIYWNFHCFCVIRYSSHNVKIYWNEILGGCFWRFISLVSVHTYRTIHLCLAHPTWSTSPHLDTAPRVSVDRARSRTMNFSWLLLLLFLLLLAGVFVLSWACRKRHITRTMEAQTKLVLWGFRRDYVGLSGWHPHCRLDIIFTRYTEYGDVDCRK